MAIGKKKTRTAYFCSQCGSEHVRWQGQCRECGEWNSLVEEKIVATKSAVPPKAPAVSSLMADISLESSAGFVTGIDEFDRVMGGQIIPGMTVLIGGDPGIGKSTLMLQVAEALSRQSKPVLYVTGEESLPQLKLRAERLGVTGSLVTVVNETSLEAILNLIGQNQFGAVIVDSIQTTSSADLDSPPGTVGQIRESASQMILQAKSAGFALFLVGHVTKGGMIAGPKVLEHMVDTVISFEGDSAHLYRILRVTKNRFGSTSDIGLFEMTAAGLTTVSNPSSFFLSQSTDTNRTGAVVAGICEGNRTLLVEVQALVTSASYGNPQRVAGGIDSKKLALLLAILEKRCDFPMGTNDVFVSVAGGLRLQEPSLDLPIMSAIISSLLNKPVSSDTVVLGEVGLSGEVRGISMIDRRLSEATKLGFKRAIIPESNRAQVMSNSIKPIGVKNIAEALEHLFD